MAGGTLQGTRLFFRCIFSGGCASPIVVPQNFIQISIVHEHTLSQRRRGPDLDGN
jgi:hypothetical protein